MAKFGPFLVISGHFRPCKRSEIVQTKLQASILYWESIYVDFTISVVKSNLRLELTQMANFDQFPAISGHVHGPRWYRMSKHLFLVGINVALTISALKSISEAGVDPDGQFWAISSHFWPRTWSKMGQDKLQASIF